jgi:predicted nucleic acid-binding protein
VGRLQFELQLPGEGVWDATGDHAALLRSQGVNIPLADVVIAKLSMSLNLELWARDKHFQDVRRVLPSLRLFQENTVNVLNAVLVLKKSLHFKQR